MRTLKLSHDQVAVIIAALKIAQKVENDLLLKSTEISRLMPDAKKEGEHALKFLDNACIFSNLKGEIENGDFDV
jgi:hypothetical protein